MPSQGSQFHQFNNDPGRCSAWIKAKKRCCQRAVSAADLKTRNGLLSLPRTAGSERDDMSKAAALYFCNGWHRPGGKHPVDGSAITMVVAALQKLRKAAPTDDGKASQGAEARLDRPAGSAEEEAGPLQVTRQQRSRGPLPEKQGRPHAQPSGTPQANAESTPRTAQGGGEAREGLIQEGSRRGGSERRAQANTEEVPKPSSERRQAPASSKEVRSSPPRQDRAEPPAPVRRSTRIAARLADGQQAVSPAPAISPLPAQESEPSDPPVRRSARLRALGERTNVGSSEGSQSEAAPAARRPHTIGKDRRLGNERACRDVNAAEQCPVCVDALGSDGPWARCNLCSNDYHVRCLTTWFANTDYPPHCGHW